MHQSRTKRILALFLCAMMLLGMFPGTAAAAETGDAIPAETPLSEEAGEQPREAATHTVTFAADDGSEPLTVQVPEGDPLEKPEDPTRDGYAFVCWNYAETEWDFSAPVTEDLTLTAVWDEIPAESENAAATEADESTVFTVTFDPAGGSDVPAQTVAAGSTAAEPEAPTKEGSTFVCWMNGETQWDFTAPVTEDVTLTAVWDEIPAESENAAATEADESTVFTVTFDPAGGSDVPAQTVAAGSTAAEPEAPTKEGSTFVCWMNGETQWDFTAPVTEDLTLTASWETAEPETVTVTFDSCGGSEVEPQTVPAGSSAVQPKDPVLDGYSFVCWLNGETQWDFTAPVTEDLTLTASWEEAETDYYRVISRKEYAISPGVKEINTVINDETATKQNKSYMLEIDLSNPDVTVMPSYKNMDPNNWGTQVMSEQAAAAERLGYNVVGAINVNLSWDTISPVGMLVINGTKYHEDTSYYGASGAYLVIYEDDTAELRSGDQPLQGNEYQAISGFGWLVKDGVNVYSEDHTGARAPRTCMGVREDGSLVLYVVDGRQDPVSVGMTMYELAEMMLDMGCVDAVNCDGGGSSTFLSQREGGDLTVKNVPSDGTERATLGGLLVISTAASDGTFNHASVTAEGDYFTPGSQVRFSASGVDASGAAAPLPTEGISWALEDPGMGAISEDGVFTSNGTMGIVTAQFLYNNEVVGSASVTIMEPDYLAFFEPSRSMALDASIDLEMLMQGEGKTIVYKPSDFTWELELLSANDASVTDPASIGWIREGTTEFASNASLSGDILATASYTRTDGQVLSASATISVGKLPAVFWDYEDGDQAVEIWEQVTVVDETTGEESTTWQMKTDEDGNLVYETKYFDAEDYYNALMVANANSPTVEEQMSSHFGLRSDRNAKGHTEIVDIDSGEPVRFGDKSLKLCYDFTAATGAPSVLGYGYMQNTNYAPGSPTGIGMWVYVPEGTPAYSMKSIVQSAGKAIYLTYGYTYTNEAGETVTTTSLADMAGKGWIYISASLVGKGDGTFKMLRNYTIRLIAEGFATNPDRYASGAIYIDNIEFIYGYDNKDTANPTVTDVYNYANGVSVAKDGSTVFESNEISFAAEFADDGGENATGMDLNSARVYIDGVNMSGSEGFVVTQDNLMVLPNVKLTNGLHSIRVRIRDNYGNETNEIRYFTVAGTEDSDTSVSFAPTDASASPYLGSEYTMALTAENGANISVFDVTLNLSTNMGAPVVTFPEGVTGTSSYNGGTGQLVLRGTLAEGAVPEQLAVLTFQVPADLIEDSSFAYSVSSGSFTTRAESDFTNTFCTAASTVAVKAHYQISASAAVIGHAFDVTVTDEVGSPVAGATVYVNDTACETVTDADGKVTMTQDTAGQITIYASYIDDSGAVKRSWNQDITVHAVAGEGSAAPFFVQNNASPYNSSGKNITWMSSISDAKDEAVLRLYTEDPGLNEAAEFVEYTGATEFVNFASESVRLCTVELKGLSSGSTYYYCVGDGETWSDVLSFTLDADKSSTNFFIIGDTQTTNTSNVETILGMIGRSGVSYDFAIQTGDAVDDSSKYAYWTALSTVFDAGSMNGVDMIHVLGNHEFYGDDNGEITKAIYNLPSGGSGSYYSYEYGDIYVAVINYASSGGYSEAFRWLAEDAKQSDCRWKVLTMHVPAYGTNADAVNEFVNENLPAAAQAAGIDFVFSGHDHSYARTMPMVDGAVDEENGIVYFICGSTGEKSYTMTVNPDYNFAYTSDSYGAMYMSVEANAETITIKATDVNGNVIDSYSKTYTACQNGKHHYACDPAAKTVSCVHCGDLPSGIVSCGGSYYYAITGTLHTGWRSALESTDLYYFDPTTCSAVTGVVTIDGKEFTFNDQGVLVRGAFVQEDGGTKYYFGKHYLCSKWVKLEEGSYWVDGDGFVVYGNYPHQEYNHAECIWYYFDEETGLLQGACSGFLEYKGQTYYCDEAGKVIYGPILLEDGIIFTATLGQVYKNRTCYIDKDTTQNGCALETGKYWCDENGYIVGNGFADIDGETYYFTDFVRAKGFTKIGDDYYLFNAGNGKMYTDATMWVGANDYGVTGGMYYFQVDGTMFVPDLVNGKKEIIEENGNLYFTVDGVKMTNGLVELEGEYYYAQSSGILVTDRTVWVSQTNGLEIGKGGWRAFGSDGKMAKTGFVTGGDGYTYYYDNMVLALGFTKIEEDYYLFNAGSGKMYADATMWVGANDYGVTGGMYYFQVDGTMFVPDPVNGKKEIVEEGGNLYFTIDGVKMTNGLNELDDEYYYAQSSSILVTGNTVWVGQNNGLEIGKGGWRAFGSDGKMVKTGFVTDSDGYTYYYEDMALALGFTKIGEDYYLFNTGSGKMYTNATMWVGSNDYGIAAGMYYFDAEGKMSAK